MNSIAERIKEIRIENKLNQFEFGKKIFVSQDTVSLWETGKSIPTTETLIMLCKVYKVSADYILALEE